MLRTRVTAFEAAEELNAKLYVGSNEAGKQSVLLAPTFQCAAAAAPHATMCSPNYSMEVTNTQAWEQLLVGQSERAPDQGLWSS